MERDRVKRGKTERRALEQAIEQHNRERKDDPDASRADDYARGLDGDWNSKGPVYRENYDRIFRK